MLNIPETVKALCKLDACRKNFRVHFPNGEMNDLTNADVVEESVEFSESICSQSTFKFGLSESSTIEFETVGVGNMLGMTIDCGIEIDLSSLTSAQLADIAAGTWDGEYVPVTESDLGYAFFHVPYGRFIVKQCPRDHQAMTHRRVEAYTDTKNLVTPYMQKLLEAKTQEETYTPNFALMFYSVIGWDNEQVLLDAGFTRTIVDSFDNVTPISGRNFESSFTGYDYSYVEYHYSMISILGDDIQKLHGVAGFDMVDVSNMLNSLASQLVNDYGIPESEAYDITKYINPNPALYEPTLSMPKKVVCHAMSDSIMDCSISPHLMLLNTDREGTQTYIVVLHHIEVYLENTHQQPQISVVVSSSTATNLDNAFVYQYEPPADMGWMDFEMQLKPSGTVFENGMNLNTFTESVDASKAISDFLEVNGSFAAPSRKKGYRSFSLSDTAVESLNAGEYSEFWWDEYDTIPIGKVKYSMEGSDGKESTLIYDFSDDQSVYEMDGNDILKESKKTQAEVEALFDDTFIPKLDAVAFTPIEITIGNGLPYLEAGDCIEATSYDNVTAKSYLLEQRITGIQHLTQTAESHGGDLMNAKEG